MRVQQRRKSAADGPRSARQRDMLTGTWRTAGSMSGSRLQGHPPLPPPVRPPLWSAVCSQTSTAGRHPGAKMTPGGGRLTSRAPTEARSASAPQGRQEPRRRPACDCMDGDGDRRRDDEQPTGDTRDCSPFFFCGEYTTYRCDVKYEQ